MGDSDLSDDLLRRLVEIHNRFPSGRFTLARSISGRSSHKISHPAGSVGADLSLVNDLLRRRLIEVSPEAANAMVIRVTLRGFDYVAHH